MQLAGDATATEEVGKESSSRYSIPTASPCRASLSAPVPVRPGSARTEMAVCLIVRYKETAEKTQRLSAPGSRGAGPLRGLAAACHVPEGLPEPGVGRSLVSRAGGPAVLCGWTSRAHVVCIIRVVLLHCYGFTLCYLLLYELDWEGPRYTAPPPPPRLLAAVSWAVRRRMGPRRPQDTRGVVAAG
jgi:hypothetical protein